MTTTTANRLMGRAPLLLFCIAAAIHFFCATRNWTAGFMPGHEFRQAQTAIISRYIDRENNFSLQYPDPIMGKPWSFPMEFPLYEWSVVGVGRATHLPPQVAARAVSLTCFYLMLPAAYVLLSRLGVAPGHRWLTLALILTCPVYIFYSRAFLMEAMVLMFSAWFLALFICTMQDRQWKWLLACALTGCASALIKSTTFFVWLVPAAFYGAWCLWRDFSRHDGGRAVARSIGWGVGAVALPGMLLYWWVTYTDTIKAAHSSAYIFTSKNLTTGNFGMYNLAARMSGETWRLLLDCWRDTIMPPWAIGIGVGLGAILLRRERVFILAAAGFFVAAQCLFPYAYAYQDYYFYACAVFLLCALGSALGGLLDSRLPRLLRWGLVSVPFVLQLENYRQGYFQLQMVQSNGGYGLTNALQDLTPKESIIVVAGDDWSAIIPYYSYRRALMIRNGLEYDGEYLERAFKDLKDETVSALVLVRKERGNQQLVRRAAAAFDLDPEIAFSHAMADVYLNRSYRDDALFRLKATNPYDQITVQGHPNDIRIGATPPREISASKSATDFRMITPHPTHYLSTYGYSMAEDVFGRPVLNTHPDADLWVPPPDGAREIFWDFGIQAAAYEREGAKTDGVDFVILGESPDGSRREIYRRWLDPANKASDRGPQHVVVPYEPAPPETLVFQSRPHDSPNFDWAYFLRVEVR